MVPLPALHTWMVTTCASPCSSGTCLYPHPVQVVHCAAHPLANPGGTVPAPTLHYLRHPAHLEPPPCLPTQLAPVALPNLPPALHPPAIRGESLPPGFYCDWLERGEHCKDLVTEDGRCPGGGGVWYMVGGSVQEVWGAGRGCR